MKVALEISSQRIADLMITAIESGDPVTSAHRGGWCAGIGPASGNIDTAGLWYADPKFYDAPFVIEIVEVDDETTGHQTKHQIGNDRMAAGLAVMASEFGHLFEQITGDNIDAPCADIFLQCIVFGEEKYA
jgi:hypothetical protein